MPLDKKAFAEAVDQACCAVASGSAQYSREEILMLKVGELMLHRGFVESAIDRLSQGAREMGKSGHQIAVLKYDVEELCRRAEDMHNVSWPNK
jgi:hypothetical protein